MKINFVIAGVQKAGTSALRSYLKDHPEICIPDADEVHFFDTEEYFQGAQVDYSKYHSFFCPDSSGRMLGEATPIYIYWKNAIERVWNYNKDMKIIVLLRNPITRAYSHWNMERSRGADTLTFSEAIRNERSRCRNALPFQHRVYSYIDRGFYVEQLRRLWAYFSEHQTLILNNDDLRRSPVKVLNKVSCFLNIGKFPQNDYRSIHSTPYSSPLKQSDRVFLRDIFEYEIRQLERLLEWDCSGWLELENGST